MGKEEEKKPELEVVFQESTSNEFNLIDADFDLLGQNTKSTKSKKESIPSIPKRGDGRDSL